MADDEVRFVFLFYYFFVHFSILISKWNMIVVYRISVSNLCCFIVLISVYYNMIYFCIYPHLGTQFNGLDYAEKYTQTTTTMMWWNYRRQPPQFLVDFNVQYKFYSSYKRYISFIFNATLTFSSWFEIVLLQY